MLHGFSPTSSAAHKQPGFYRKPLTSAGIGLAVEPPEDVHLVPAARIRRVNDRSIDPHGAFVLYWMIAARRLRWNFALQHAVQLANELRRPLVIFEPLRCDYRWASDRLHRFVLDGMAANANAAARTRATYYPYLEPTPGAARGLLAALTAHACAVVTDAYPSFFLPALVQAGGRASRVRLEAVDGNGLIPIADQRQAFTAARSYRAFAQRELREHLQHLPEQDPLAHLTIENRRALPDDVHRRWPAAPPDLLEPGAPLHGLPIDHGVAPAPARGGSAAADRALRRFLQNNLAPYADRHNHPDDDCTSRLSPYLHFGHISAHEIFASVMTAERWTTRKLAPSGGGAREGWWGVSPSAEGFLDQLVVWRELAFNGCAWLPRYADYGSLPAWARGTLEAHAADARPHRYSFAALAAADTHDELWNAAQRQLQAEGWFHGYLRMLWGKKILEWAPDGAAALEWMEALMNRHSLDGRDPNSYAGYTWVLGRYDRPWPERPVFGTVRAMTSESAKRKLRVRRLLEKYGAAPRVGRKARP